MATDKCIKCGSYAFNLYKEDIDQGGLCDVHYCQYRAHRAEALAEQPAQDDPDLQDKDPELVEQPAQHEPFTHYRHYDNGLQDWADEKTIPLYKSPLAQRKPLTRKQLADAWIGTAHITHATERQIAYARAVEAAHGIKEKS